MKKTNVLIRFIFACILLYCSYESHAGLKVAINNGPWKNSGTWQGGNTPGPGDSIVIPNGKRVVLTDQEDYAYSSLTMQLNIMGELNFQNGKKLTLPTGSYIVLHVGAYISGSNGGGNSSWIYVGPTMVWHAAHGTITGYMVLPYVPLPVEMNAFNATLDNYNQQVILRWETFAEVNNSHFEVERSSDGWKFICLGKVPGNGTNSVGAKFEFIDHSPLKGANYYRLKQVDYIGTFRYTRIIYLLNDDRLPSPIKIFPNPSGGELYLRMLTEHGEDNIILTIYNNSGKRIVNNQLEITEGFNDLTLDEIISDLPKGVYSVHLNSTRKNYSEKLIIQ